MSSRNATKHGLTARHVLLPHEDARQYAEMRERLLDELKPKGVIEDALIERIGGLVWRLKRIPSIEAVLFVSVARDLERHDGTTCPDVPAVTDGDAEGRATSQDRTTARIFEVLFDKDLVEKLSRYEKSLSRELRLAVEQLFKLQTARQTTLQDALPRRWMRIRSRRRTAI